MCVCVHTTPQKPPCKSAWNCPAPPWTLSWTSETTSHLEAPHHQERANPYWEQRSRDLCPLLLCPGCCPLHHPLALFTRRDFRALPAHPRVCVPRCPSVPSTECDTRLAEETLPESEQGLGTARVADPCPAARLMEQTCHCPWPGTATATPEAQGSCLLTPQLSITRQIYTSFPTGAPVLPLGPPTPAHLSDPFYSFTCDPIPGDTVGCSASIWGHLLT